MCFAWVSRDRYTGDDRSQGAGGTVVCSGLGKPAAKVTFALSRNSFSVFA